MDYIPAIVVVLVIWRVWSFFTQPAAAGEGGESRHEEEDPLEISHPYQDDFMFTDDGEHQHPHVTSENENTTPAAEEAAW